jgi:hypothetical protein
VQSRASVPPPATVPPVPANPGDVVKCADFTTQELAQARFDIFFPHYGDVARLNPDGDGTAGGSLPKRELLSIVSDAELVSVGASRPLSDRAQCVRVLGCVASPSSCERQYRDGILPD